MFWGDAFCLHLFSHVPQVAVRFWSGDGAGGGGGCGSDGITRSKNKVAVKAERR